MKCEDKSKDLKYSILELVMGKIRGYPPWPAIILSRDLNSKKTYFVCFIADQSYAYLPENQLFQFNEKCLEENFDTKPKALQNAMQYAMKLYKHEMTFDEYLEQYPDIIATKDASLAEGAQKTKKNIEDILLGYKISAMFEYLVDQISALNSGSYEQNDIRYTNILELIKEKIETILKCEKIKEKVNECAYSKVKIMKTFEELKEKAQKIDSSVLEKLNKLLNILS